MIQIKQMFIRIGVKLKLVTCRVKLPAPSRLLMLLLAGYGITAQALPTGGKVVEGNVALQTPNSSTLNVVQGTQRGIINWGSFSVASDERVSFQQPGSTAVTLNRVVGGDLSSIFGRIDANGQIFLINPSGITFAPGASVNVSGLVASTLDISNNNFRAGSYKLVKRFPLKSMPSHLDFTPDSGMVFISLQGTDALVAIDLRTMNVAWNMPVGRAPAGVMWHNGNVLVANMGADDVALVDPRTGQVKQRLHIGRGAHQIFRSPDGKTLWVNARIDSTVTVLDATTLKPQRSYKLPGGPDDLVFAPDGQVWFTLRFANKLAVLDPATGNFTTIAVGRSPHGIFINPKAVAAK